MIEPRQWKALWLFSRTGKLTNTAREMYLFQPALSAMMRKMEEETGVSLFIRTGHNRISLSPAGRVAAEFAGQLLDLQQTALDAIRQTSRSLGICAPGIRFYLEKPGQLKTEENLQGWDTEMLEDDRDLEAGLDSGRWQAVILHLPPEAGYLVQPLFTETLFLAVPNQHPLAQKDSIRLADLAGQNLLLHTGIGFWNGFVRSRLADAHFASIDDFAAFQSATLVGAFPYFTTNVVPWTIPDNVRILPIDDPQVQATYYLVCQKKDAALFHHLCGTLYHQTGTNAVYPAAERKSS
ncbi:LysR family transcriptional regulator [uncultured Faecalibaculum sp.]|uniref:LysR family transcriptional regulator n=1 Tax=uncultured Faecalibaculum sp. TaxID=1729681 RepID=UPI0026326BF7|nr:LysR family transcriptional regulator [uncultured Faecalibaculum sp.]